MTRRVKYQEAGDRLSNLSKSHDFAEHLTLEEREWVEILREKCWSISNRMKHFEPEG